jgi:serine/threonine protein kinase
MLIGTMLGPYEIQAKLGEGGMGEVYRARDTRLDRTVAIKVLPAEISGDPDRRARFQREAKTIAGLTHPHICTLYDVGEHDGSTFLVMEHLEGETLADRLVKGRLPLGQALTVATHIADALAAAHHQEIIHRDLKPGNVMLTKTGAKLLDFGLAKHLIAPDHLGSQDTTVAAMTREGTTVGTLAYMPPEQLRGEPVDARADIFSFGVVLYEMLAGTHPFKQRSEIDTASAILNSVPRPLPELCPDLPALLQHIVRKMLAKDAGDRYDSVHDVRLDLRELQEESEHRPRRDHGKARRLYWAGTVALVVVAFGIWGFLHFLSREAAPAPTIVPVTTSGGSGPSLSPDAKSIAFVWSGEKSDNADIYIKELDGPGFDRRTTDPAPDLFPAWSWDGRQVAFLRMSGDRAVLYTMSALGGGERKVVELSSVDRTVFGGGLSWSLDGKSIAFADKKSPKEPYSIWSLSLDTLEKQQVTFPDAKSLGDGFPALSPDGRSLAFLRRSEFVRPALYVMRLPGGTPRLVTDTVAWSVCWTADSRELVFATPVYTGQPGLWRVPVNGGTPQRIPARGDRLNQPALRRNRLAYANVTGTNDIWRLDLTGTGQATPSSAPLFSSSSSEYTPRISPDGRKMAFASDSSGYLEIWVSNPDGTGPMKLTDVKAAGSSASPDWSHDGKQIAFDSNKSGVSKIYVVGADGGPVRQLTTDASEEVVPHWSRDDRWIYFGSNRSGSWQVWKAPSQGGRAVQVTREGGMVAFESADGYVYYCAYYGQKRGIWQVPVAGGRETLVLDRGIVPSQWELTDEGIYFAEPPATVSFYDFATRSETSLGPALDGSRFLIVPDGVGVAPDGKSLLFIARARQRSDIMMIDNFR